ncbi:PREDICTED: POU domain, class 6, transcription factor 1 isoform X1 [Cyprinodon variegatus]|uniref:POU domain protein n=2 Tax=Cyprinodon variegatus TaxID=28743 RepID=A0A3Q2D251_CYPVA|nr:PREDICTED: POU domain, class 6, transcription factor 1 isoform X1 [Cyprinodon variegatus]XP_015240855.1 PREDICTED: POU domain, class 6, transcription factor 1 isoform X1 [Cyprinodon variegatus]XP_015240864.1 PREDICTED: POU domain, class 6, transcription factor 1 isoform X1 [Cyprinodon variegatus]
MNPQHLPAKDAPLTVNEQVIVMSGHETIRVLEVEVDAAPPPSAPDGGSEAKSEEAMAQCAETAEATSTQRSPTVSHCSGEAVIAEQHVASGDSSAPVVQTVNPAVSLGVSLAQPQAAMPVTVQGCPQVLTQESLAALMTGMMAQTGSLGQPLLIPLNMAGSIASQGGLAVLTLPTTNVATLPGFTGANPAGNLLKLPFAGLQAATVLNSVQPQLQANTQLFQPQAASIQAVQAAVQQVSPQQTRVNNTQVTSAQSMPVQATSVANTISQPSISVAALQTAGLSINPAIISAASLGAQPQFFSSLTSTPIINSTVPSMAGITSQIITNAQGQVIGTLPLLVNPASLAGGAAASTLPLQGLQLQTIAPQLLLNTQGQIIATVGNGPAAVATSAAVLPKTTAPPTINRPNTQASVTSVTQSPVVIAPQPSALKTSTTLSSAAPIPSGDMAKVGQLVNKPQQAVSSEEGINLEEIREFAKNFKIRRLSLGLTQTQVGQALTATEGPAYSQSAICRFEKLDITPKSAQKLKPVLEKWLAEAEHWNLKGPQNLMEFVGGEPSKKRKRRTSFTPQAIEVLNSYFEKNSLPTGQEITEIARELNYDREVVRVWFCNRRQTLKNTSKINVFQV